MTPSFRKIVLDRFKAAICSACRKTVEKRFPLLFPSTPLDSVDIYINTLNDYIGTIHKDSIGITRIRFFVEYKSEVGVFQHVKDREYDYSTIVDAVNAHLLVECEADFKVGLNDFKIKRITPFCKEPVLHRTVSDQMIPVINSNEYDEYAEEFLRTYYPEALRTPTRIDPDLLLSRMGLKVFDVCITEDDSILGAMVFRPCCLETYTVTGEPDECQQFEPGSVIIDPRVFITYSDGAEAHKKIHEAIHWFYDRKAFELSYMFNSNENRIECPAKTSGDSIDWKEYHANELPAHILLPKEQFYRKATQTIEELVKEKQPAYVVDIIDKAIRELSDFFGVSKLSVKLRLIELGVTDALGVLDWADNHYVPHYRVSAEAAKKGRTFSISSKSFFTQLTENQEFRQYLENNSYTFVENHICKVDSKYLTRKNGKYFLTEYARYHLDECCIPFESDRNQLLVKLSHSAAFFAGVGASYKFDPIPMLVHSDDIAAVKNELAGLEKEVIPVLKKMPRSFGEALQYLIDWRKMTQEDLENSSGIDARVIRYMLNGERINKERLVRICFGLCLPDIIAFELCRLSPSEGIDPSNPNDMKYVCLIRYGQNLKLRQLTELFKEDKKKAIER